MKALKWLLIVIVVLIAVFLIVAAFLPDSYSVESSVTLNVPVTVVFHSVNSYTDREKWDPWLELDPEVKVNISGPQSGPGAMYSWNGPKIGSGTMKILESDSNKSVLSQLTFTAPMESHSKVMWELEAIDSTHTKVTWKNFGELNYPTGRIFGLFIGGLKKDFDRGLNNLKKVLESPQQASEQ